LRGGSCGADKDVCVSTSRRVSEQRIDIKYCVKLRKNSSDTCTMLSEPYGGEAKKKSRVF